MKFGFSSFQRRPRVGLAAVLYFAAGLGWVCLPEVSGGVLKGREWERAKELLWVGVGAALVYILLKAARARWGDAADLARREAREEEARRRVAWFAASPDYVHVLGEDGRLLEANAAFYRALGYDPKTPPSLNVTDWDARWSAEEVRAKLADLAGRTEVFETIHRDRHGASRIVELSVGGFVSGGERGFFCIGRDLTERRRRESGNARTERIAGLVLLSGGIAHEMNNALASIALAGELLKQARPELAQDMRLQTILNSARSGAEVIHRVLTFSQGIEGDRVIVDLAVLLAELAAEVDARGYLGLLVRREFEAGVPSVNGDAAQLREVLRGVVGNAIDAMRDRGGRLTIGLRVRRLGADAAARLGGLAPGVYVECSVADTGPGLSDEARRQLFSPFFTTKPVGEGKGLGLAMGLGVVRSHGGMIEHVDPPGGGAEFRVLLPAVREAD